MRNPLLAAVRSTMARSGVPGADRTLVIGLSGGADSVALTDALAALDPERRPRLVAAHLDHGLRPDSPDDARFCERLCERLGIPFRAGRADVARRAHSDGDGIEAAARCERYAFLRRVARETGAAAIAVAHTRDDQAETLLLHLLRGAGGSGLGGMRHRSGDLLRPLLEVSREQVLEHLRSRGLEWREDPSNADPAFTRNRVRHELLPWLESRFNPRLRETLAGTAGLLADEDDHLEAEAAGLLAAASPCDRGWSLPRAALCNAAPALARRALRQLVTRAAGQPPRRVQVERLLALARDPGASGRRLPLPGGREARIRFETLWVGPPRTARPFAVPLEVPGSVVLPDGRAVTARAWESRGFPREGAALVMAGDQLTVRTRRPGDRARRNGLEVSLKRLLLDRRVPADRRDELPLVARGHEILWGPGLGIDAPDAGGSRCQIRLEPSPGTSARFSVERG
jgi:tRNA(Ile)-lysidine synthase